MKEKKNIQRIQTVFIQGKWMRVHLNVYMKLWSWALRETADIELLKLFLSLLLLFFSFNFMRLKFVFCLQSSFKYGKMEKKKFFVSLLHYDDWVVEIISFYDVIK